MQVIVPLSTRQVRNKYTKTPQFSVFLHPFRRDINESIYPGKIRFTPSQFFLVGKTSFFFNDFFVFAYRRRDTLTFDRRVQACGTLVLWPRYGSRLQKFQKRYNVRNIPFL